MLEGVCVGSSNAVGVCANGGLEHKHACSTCRVQQSTVGWYLESPDIPQPCAPAGATTNSDSGVTDILKVLPVLRHMAAIGMPLLVHGEVTDPSVDMFDREAVFIYTKLVRWW